jgi:hypothetical protein
MPNIVSSYRVGIRFQSKRIDDLHWIQKCIELGFYVKLRDPPPKFLARDDCLLFPMAMRGNEMESIVTQYECKCRYRKTYKKHNIFGKSIQIAIFSVQWLVSYFYFSTSKNRIYRWNQFILICYPSTYILFAPFTWTDSPTGHCAPRVRGGQDFGPIFPRRTAIHGFWSMWAVNEPDEWFRDWRPVNGEVFSSQEDLDFHSSCRASLAHNLAFIFQRIATVTIKDLSKLSLFILFFTDSQRGFLFSFTFLTIIYLRKW